MTLSTASQQSNAVPSKTSSALMEGLQPVLRSTLTSLNVNLDYELTRYRYAKRGEEQPGMVTPQFRPRRKASLDLIQVPQPQPPRIFFAVTVKSIVHLRQGKEME